MKTLAGFLGAALVLLVFQTSLADDFISRSPANESLALVPRDDPDSDEDDPPPADPGGGSEDPPPDEGGGDES